MTEEEENRLEEERTFENIEDQQTGVPVEPEVSYQYDEETAAEYTPNPGLVGGRGTTEISSDRTREQVKEEDETAGKGVGALGIALSIVSLFFLPVIFAIAGIVFGAIAVRKNRQALGYTAVAIGAFSLIMSFFFAPFVA
ncbi:DUF4190 domain-containing protein [Salipaludibacillus sp. HK11]|uniref:DUF4190 domain-containing protein n=1 Tax=Salipaludibacillus sp. HK11 TaxID=3394320 RepID=UPI0039FC7D7E